MSNALFPTLPGLMFPVMKSPVFSTTIRAGGSGREVRRSNFAATLWNIGLSFEFLRDTAALAELDALLGFFVARRGAFDSFLFRDPDDCTVSNQQIGMGDGVTTGFQLRRTLGSATEPVCNVDSASITVSPNTSHTVSATGLLTFGIAPAAGVPVAWSGNFYYRCRFMTDTSEFQKFAAQLWEQKKCELRGTLGLSI